MTSLYRKWRSSSFDDLVGQEHVVRTLRNALRQGRVAHAYLFTGPRGTGKTSTARILAKAVNCLNPRDGNPCTVCEACRAAQEGRALDVIEIDAASNTSVDNVRELRERVGYAAGEGRYKVYIVDEVHRLSGAAFDAFLKTLEEPPPHVIFVFASTEPQKVPATIASRCQRFDFRRHTAADVVARLRHVAREEGLAVSDGALALIAQNAHGSLRDALGLLDQAAAYTQEAIEESDVRQSLGLADPTVVIQMSDAMIGGDAGPGLDLIGRFVDQGGESQQLVLQLIGYWRSLLLLASGAAQSDADADPGWQAALRRQGALLSTEKIVAVLHALSDNEFGPKYDLVDSLPLELGFVRAALALKTMNAGGVGSTVHGGLPAAQPPVSQPRGEPVISPPSRPVEPAEPKAATKAPEGNGVVAGDSITTPPVLSAPPDVGDLAEVWNRVVESMRSKNLSLQAMLRSGYLLKIDAGQLTVGFLYEFHSKQFADVKKRKILEEVVAEVMGSSYRVQCVRASEEEIEAARGSGTIVKDDGFIDDAAEQLRQFHARQLSNGNG